MLQSSKIEEAIPDEPAIVDLGPRRFVDETLHHPHEAQLPHYMLNLEIPYMMEDPFAARAPNRIEEPHTREGEPKSLRKTNLRRGTNEE